MSKKSKSLSKKGFTIVELLVVIVVIGILAAITMVVYGNVTNRANTSAGQSDAGTFVGKASAYAADQGVTVPTTYASITGAPGTKLYQGQGYQFTTTSSGAIASPGETMAAFRATGISNDELDFLLCGTANAGAAPGSYAGITIPTGIKVGYWDYVNVNENTTTYTVGTTSGGNIQCYKVGIAEAAMAMVMAIYQETGSWPTSAATIQAYTSTKGILLPAGTTISGLIGTGGAVTTGNGNTTVDFNCKNTGCANGGRIIFWDYTTGGSGTLSTAANSVYYGGATQADTFLAAP